MKGRQVALLFSPDVSFVQRVIAYTLGRYDIKPRADTAALARALDRINPTVLLFDLRTGQALDLLDTIRSRWPDTLVIAFGAERSEPYLAALELGVFALQPLQFEGDALVMLLRQAHDHLALADELRHAREQGAAFASRPTPDAVEARASDAARAGSGSALPLRQLFQPLRHFDNLQQLLQGIVDGIASTASVLRAGIFARLEPGSAYRYQAGIGCLDETRTALFADDDVLVRWLEVNAQIVTRDTAAAAPAGADRRALRQSLDELGAEVIVPIQGRRHMLGWLLLGRPATGGTFAQADLREFTILAEHVATSLENAVLYREIAIQKAFAETLLQSLPTGIVAAGADGNISWFNAAAERILGVSRESVIHSPVETVGGRIAVHLRQCLHGQGDPGAIENWEAANGKQYLSLHTTRLMDGNTCVGAVAFVHDRTRDEMLTRRQREMERISLWTDVAANMSHEIRNPMVAIKTFAQLLPERYDDPEFRREFSSLVAREVDRLDAIIQQINSFAKQPTPAFAMLSVEDVIREAQNQAAYRLPEALDTPIHVAIEPNLPRMRGDRQGLAECLTHVFINAMEALYGKPHPEITLTARAGSNPGDDEPCIVIQVRDNAGGMAPNVRQNIFSPFCTTKERAMGLGLPMTQRIVAEHGGQVAVDTDSRGTCVTITLPTEIREPEQEQMHAAHTDRG